MNVRFRDFTIVVEDRLARRFPPEAGKEVHKRSVVGCVRPEHGYGGFIIPDLIFLADHPARLSQPGDFEVPQLVRDEGLILLVDPASRGQVQDKKPEEGL